MMLQGSVIVRIIVTGIVAIVPSAQDNDLTRLIAPKHASVSADHPMIPEHFAYLEVHSKNLLPGGRKENFRMHLLGDERGDDRVIYVVDSEEIRFGNVPSNRTLVRNTIVPKSGLLKPEGAEELSSTSYELELVQLCPSCKTLVKDFFDLPAHPDKVAARMDLIGGRESVRGLRLGDVWQAAGSMLKQPLAQEIVYEFDVPACGQRLLLSKFAFAGDHPTESTISLFSSDGQPIEVTLGNSPLLSILRLDANFKGDHTDDHFALFYDMFTPAPAARPLLELVPKAIVDVSGPKDNCIPPHGVPQDPTQ